VRRSLLVAILTGAALLPVTAASAGHGPAKIRLALVPLQRAELGPAGASFPLNYGSGPMGVETRNSFFGITSYSESSNGPIDGYSLDYGDPLTGSTGVMEVRTSVEQYRSPAAALDGLFEARFENTDLRSYSSRLLPVTVKRVKPEKVGGRRIAYLITLAAPNLNPIVRLDEQITSGRYVLDLTVTAGSATAAEHAAPHLLRALRDRLRRLIGGHSVAERPVKLPPEPQSGQAPGGPDLSTLILQPSDVGQSHAVNLIQVYVANPPALSAYLMGLAPAGPYDALQQQIGWWPTATEATYAEAYEGPLTLGGSFTSGTITPVDLSAVSDPATGYLVSDSGVTGAAIELTNGQAGEFIFAVSKSALQASDVQNLAQAAANRLDAGLP
jgi:hypothetical protein